MVYVQMTEMTQLCVRVTVTGRAVNVNVSLFRVLYEVITIANIFCSIRVSSHKEIQNQQNSSTIV
jgi:hypothetical protein